MADEKFKVFQKMRSDREACARRSITEWAMAEGLDTMTIGQLKSLQTMVVHMTNGAARDAYDLGQAPAPEAHT